MPDWQIAEALAGGHMKALGLNNVRFTQRGADGGVDMLADGVAAEVKCRQNKTSRPEIQRLFGEATRRGVQGVFYSFSGYSAPAVENADETGVALFKMNSDGSVTSINQHARQMEAGRRPYRARLRNEDLNALLVVAPPPPQPVVPAPTADVPPRPFPPQPNATTSAVYLPPRQFTVVPPARSKWSWLTLNGRWYFYLAIGSAGALACVPFIHAAVKIQSRRHWTLAALYSFIDLVLLIVFSALKPDGRDVPMPEPANSILLVITVAIITSACVLLAPIRRLVFKLDGETTVSTTGAVEY